MSNLASASAQAVSLPEAAPPHLPSVLDRPQPQTASSSFLNLTHMALFTSRFP